MLRQSQRFAVISHSVFEPSSLVKSLNCAGNKLCIIDKKGTLQVYSFMKCRSTQAESQEASVNAIPGFKRKHVWDVRWSSDNPDHLAVMEKNRLYIFRSFQPEEPVIKFRFLF